MRIVMDKPSSLAAHESAATPSALESSENNTTSFLDCVMDKDFVDSPVMNDPVAQQATEELAAQADGQPPQDAAVLAQLLIDMQQQTSKAKENNTLTGEAEGQFIQAPINGVETKATTMNALNEAAAEEDNGANPEGINNNLVSKPMNNQKTAVRGNPSNSSNTAIVNNDSDARMEAMKASLSPATTSTVSKVENVSKNQMNDMLINNVLPGATLHAKQYAASVTKNTTTSSVGGELLSASVSFHIDTLEHLKDKVTSTGVQHININVAPAELGPISARLKMVEGNRLELEILAKNNDVVQVIKSQLNALREQFSNVDMHLDTINVNVQSQNSFSNQSDTNSSDYNQSIPMDYMSQPADNSIKAKEKSQKVSETLIDAYV